MNRILSLVRSIQGVAVIALFFSAVFLGGSEFQTTEEMYQRQWDTGLTMVIWACAITVACEILARLIYYIKGDFGGD